MAKSAQRIIFSHSSNLNSTKIYAYDSSIDVAVSVATPPTNSFPGKPQLEDEKNNDRIFSHNTKREKNPGKTKFTKLPQRSVQKDTQQNVSTRQTRKRSQNYLKYSFETQSDFKETFLLFTQLTSSKSRINCLLHLTDSHTCSQNNCLLKMVSARKKKGRNKRQFSWMDDTANNFVIGNGTTVNTMRNEALESQAHGYQENFGEEFLQCKWSPSPRKYY